MTWFKVDDKFHDHPKARRAGKAAVGVWLLAGTWCADHLTDGFVPAHVLVRWGTKADARKLVDAGLWEPDEMDGEQGWRFLKWERYQPTRAATKQRRDVRAAAGRAGGLASGRARANNSASTEGGPKSKQVASPLVEPPTRPDPNPTLVLVSDENVSRADVERICEHLAARIEANGSKRPTITQGWRDAARLLLDRDNRTEEQVIAAIDWCQGDEFWRSNILSMPKLREKYDQLRLQATRAGAPATQRRGDIDWDAAFARAAARTEGESP